MPRVTDIPLVRSILERDRPWAAYAIGDLSPPFAHHCQWTASENREALALLYRGFDPPILFGLGTPDGLAAVFQEVEAAKVSLHLRTESLHALQPRFEAIDVTPMWRMLLDPATFSPADCRGVETLGIADADDILRLYADGLPRAESPDFFFPPMLEQGMFRGVRERGELVAVAGTHLFAPELGICAIGNVYTRHDRRGRGLGAGVTSAVAAEAFDRNAGTVVLNVRHVNGAAARVYERLGFRRYCEFVEGLARLVER